MRHSILLASFLCLAAAGPVKPLIVKTPEWLAKGDTVFVSADLVSVQTDLLGSGSSIRFTIAGCEPLAVSKVKKKEGVVQLTDALGSTHCFLGDWSTRMHRTEKECQDRVSAGPPPKVVVEPQHQCYTVQETPAATPGAGR
jgi:hypothetical protein